MLIERTIQKQIERLILLPEEPKKAIVIYGARQVGKTTLIKQIQDKIKLRSEYYNCDFLNVQDLFSYQNAINFGNIVKDIDLLILDEAQRIRDIGMVIKILVDSFPSLQVITTGSSSFELSSKINEPLPGRKHVFQLYPLSFEEYNTGKNYAERKTSIENLMRFGSYPSLRNKNENDIIPLLNELTSSYLFKDILNFQNLRKPELLQNLLRLLAFQISNEVSYTELAGKTNVDNSVVQKYIYLLEESFIIFRLPALKRNLRNEITKSRKIYFWDLGIRNSLIQNYNSFEYRNDTGALWENFCIIERMKYLKNNNSFFNPYFWRTHDQKEIDYIEESEGKLKAFEFKLSAGKKPHIPEAFLASYNNSSFSVVNKDNFMEELFG
jgi:uncharacterized protein